MSPRPPLIITSDEHILDSLHGLTLRCFGDCYDHCLMNTPTTTSSSLPTPDAMQSGCIVFLGDESPSFDSDSWYPMRGPIKEPSAPLLKDLDSFTDATSHSTFDFLPPAGEGQLFIHPTDDFLVDDIPLRSSPPTSPSAGSLALGLLPSSNNLQDSIQTWRENVIPPQSPQRQKRQRSPTEDSVTDERRTRAWSTTPQTSHIAHGQPREPAQPGRRTDPAPPD